MSDEIMGLCDVSRGSSTAVAAAARTMMGPEISLGINGVVQTIPRIIGRPSMIMMTNQLTSIERKSMESLGRQLNIVFGLTRFVPAFALTLSQPCAPIW
jgi:hypothetical protein